MSNLFKGIVVLNKTKYEELKNVGSLSLNGTTIKYDPDSTLYVDSLFLEHITKVSSLENDVGYITKSDVVDFSVKIGALPTTGVERTIYFVPNNDEKNTHTEYMWIGGRFEQIGTTEINLEQYALKSEIPTSLPASDVYDWAKSSTKPTYTASEVGAIPNSATNIVKTDVATQTINGATIFNQTIQIGGSANINENGVKITRKCTSDNNNVHEAILKVDSDGSVKIGHKNSSVNSAVEDSYISFKNDKLVYGTNNNGENDIVVKNEVYDFAQNEYDKSLNLIDFSKITTGYGFATGSAELESASDWYVTDFCKVEPNTKYVYFGISSWNTRIFDSNKNLIEIQTDDNKIINVPSNGCYVRFNSKIEGYTNPSLYKANSEESYGSIVHQKDFMDLLISNTYLKSHTGYTSGGATTLTFNLENIKVKKFILVFGGMNSNSTMFDLLSIYSVSDSGTYAAVTHLGSYTSAKYSFDSSEKTMTITELQGYSNYLVQEMVF